MMLRKYRSSPVVWLPNHPVMGNSQSTCPTQVMLTTVIDYVVSGDATSATDFAPLSGTLTITAGQTSGVIDISVLNDNTLEPLETVTVTLTNIAAGNSGVTIGGNNSATVSISDDDIATVSIIANDPDAAEPGDNGQFTILLSNTSDQDTIVSYSVSGSATAGDDYQPLAGTVLIAAGTSSATIDVNVLDQPILENSETVTLSLTGTSDARIAVNTSLDQATVTIADDDSAVVSVVASDNQAAEATPLNNGEFTVTLSEASDTATTISYTVSGSADAGDDYVSLPGTISLAAGQTVATIALNVIDDLNLENDESVTLTLNSVTSGNSSITIGASNAATVQIADNEVNPPNLLAPTLINLNEDTSSGVFRHSSLHGGKRWQRNAASGHQRYPNRSHTN